MGSGKNLDALARGLASGEISRRAALRRLAGAAIGIGAASIPGTQTLAAATSKRCPSSRRCGDKCCPRHARCRRGKCKCDSGYTKCGKKCFDLQTNANHCGACDRVCAEGRACVDSNCVECAGPSDCDSQVCDPNTNTCSDPTCSDNVKNGNESDVDCGGPDCPACGAGSSCNVPSDCDVGLTCGVDNIPPGICVPTR